MARKTVRNNGKRYNDTEKMVACQIVRANGGKLTDEILTQIQEALNIPTLSWDTVTRWYNASLKPKVEPVEKPQTQALSGESRVRYVHIVDEVETDFEKATARDIVDQTFRRYAKQANRRDFIQKTDGKDAAKVMGDMLKLMQLLDGLPTEIISAQLILNEQVEYFRENDIDFNEAQRQFLEMIKAKKASTNDKQDGDA